MKISEPLDIDWTARLDRQPLDKELIHPCQHEWTAIGHGQWQATGHSRPSIEGGGQAGAVQRHWKQIGNRREGQTTSKGKFWAAVRARRHAEKNSGRAGSGHAAPGLGTRRA